MKKSLLFMTALAAVSMNAYAATEIKEGVDYYIRNVKTGMWLNQGYSWGTKGIVKDQAKAFQFVDEDGYWALTSSTGWIKGGDEIYLDGNSGDHSVFTLLPQTDGTFQLKMGELFMTIEQNDNGLVFLTYGDAFDAGLVEESWESGLGALQSYDFYPIRIDNYSTDEARNWEILTLEEMKANLMNATAENPLDATFLIKAHMIDRNDSDNTTAWQLTVDGTRVNIGQTSSENGTDYDDLIVFPSFGWGFHLDSYTEWAIAGTYAWFNYDDAAGTCVASQVVEGAPAGEYEAIYRVADQPNTNFSLTFNGVEAEVVEYTNVSNDNPEGVAKDLWYQQITGIFADRTQKKSATFTVGEDGKLAIEMTKNCEAGQQNRFGFKSFILKCKKATNAGAGVENIAVENENAPVEYYNLQGVRVAEPSNGIYIVKQGKKVTKQVIR